MEIKNYKITVIINQETKNKAKNIKGKGKEGSSSQIKYHHRHATIHGEPRQNKSPAMQSNQDYSRFPNNTNACESK